MSARGERDADETFDRELGEFLRREASRRVSRRRRDDEVVAAIVGGRRARRPRGIPVAAMAALVLIVVVVAAIAIREGLAPNAAASPTPGTTGDPPLTLLQLSGSPCALTPALHLADGLAPALGSGPVRAVLAEWNGIASYEPDGRWNRIDILWVAERGFSGSVLLRAAALGGSAAVSFGDASEPTALPRIVRDFSAGQPIGSTGWILLADLPLLVKGPGCYGIQVDTQGSSSAIAFAAEPIDIAYDRMRQPLRLPVLSGVETCPVTPAANNISFVGGLIGGGPVYLSPAGGRAFWVADPREPGPILVHGRRVDATGLLSFTVPGTEPAAELRLPIHSLVSSPGQPPGWRQFVTILSTSAPGCYAVQIDTLTNSSVLVFAVAS